MKKDITFPGLEADGPGFHVFHFQLDSLKKLLHWATAPHEKNTTIQYVARTTKRFLNTITLGPGYIGQAGSLASMHWPDWRRIA